MNCAANYHLPLTLSIRNIRILAMYRTPKRQLLGLDENRNIRQPDIRQPDIRQPDIRMSPTLQTFLLRGA